MRMNRLIPLPTLSLQLAHLSCSCHRIWTLLIGCEAFRSWNWKWDFFSSLSLNDVSIKCHAQNVFTLDIRPSLYQTKCDIVASWPWLGVCLLQQQQQQRNTALIKCVGSTGSCTSSVSKTDALCSTIFQFQTREHNFRPTGVRFIYMTFQMAGSIFNLCIFSSHSLCVSIYLCEWVSFSLHCSLHCLPCKHTYRLYNMLRSLFTNYTSIYSTDTWICPMHLNCAYYHYSTSINYTKNN